LISFGHSGSAPPPFDALNGSRLAGPSGSHPLHAVRADELVRSSDAVRGEITVDAPAMVGVGMNGTIRLSAVRDIESREAALRLVGLRLDEVRQSREDRDSEGRVTHREDWVEARGRIFEDTDFVEPVIPPKLDAGAEWEGRFLVPAPQLGPPSAHIGESIVAWALEVRWNTAMASDIRLAVLLPVAQNPDLMRAGVGRQGGQSLMEEISADGGTVAVTSPLPAPAGSGMTMRVAWPNAPDGRAARAELHRLSNAPNAETGILASVPVDVAALRIGTDVRLGVPPEAPPSFDGAGLENRYIVRILVDRRLRSDAAIERPVGVT
jgi:hypothetical protein